MWAENNGLVLTKPSADRLTSCTGATQTGAKGGYDQSSETSPATQHVPEALVSKQEGDSWTYTPLAHPLCTQCCKASLHPLRQAHSPLIFVLGSPTSSKLGTDTLGRACRRPHHPVPHPALPLPATPEWRLRVRRFAQLPAQLLSRHRHPPP